MLDSFLSSIQLISYFLDILTVLVIVYGFGYAIWLLIEMHYEDRFHAPESDDEHKALDLTVIRVKLGSYLLLALEMFIAADLILTIGDPTLEHLLELGVIVIIRTITTHFLQKEMKELTECGVEH